jgi:hypothetical protein
VTAIHQCVEFVPKKCFTAFVNDVSQSRRMGDTHANCEVLANTMKLIGNSGYGSLLMDKEKHQDIRYISGKAKAVVMANDNDFKNMTELGKNMFELEMAKSQIVVDLPIQVGYFVLQIAKLRMLEFYYDFLDVFLERESYMLSHMDTDSLYIALAKKDLMSSIKESHILRFKDGLFNSCQMVNPSAQTLWFPRECCQEHKTFDKRTPGLFKLEYQGDEVVALCSKTYSVKCHKTQDVKFSSKGCNKSALTDVHNMMTNVLVNKTDMLVENRGFRMHNNQVCSYIQEKKGLCYFYCKRKVLNDGISTEPLNIVLCPEDV